MSSVTIRKIGEEVKARLRVRAAQAGHSLEEEIRRILAQVADDPAAARTVAVRPAPEFVASPEPAPSPVAAKATHGLADKRILLVIGGGIAAYKSLDLIRRLKERGAHIRAIMTEAAKEFITPLSVGAITGDRVFNDLFDITAEFDVGHIRLSREADLIVVAPATADLIAKMANGLASDLASAVLLATDKPVLIAPAMNPRMWEHPATRRNLATLRADGIALVGPNEGEMAERGEHGYGRMAEPLEIAAAIESFLGVADAPLAGKRIVITSGPTHEPIDPVRYIANRSSGKQGHALARAAAKAGADVILISGPVGLADPAGVSTVKVQTAREMLDAVERALPADAAIFAAAVADWGVNSAASKIKKTGGKIPALDLVENPDILATIAHRRTKRPQLVVGFAAETDNVIENAKAKLDKKGCDWIVANDVSPAGGVLGGDRNTVHLISASGVESWPTESKEDVARALVERIATALTGEAS